MVLNFNRLPDVVLNFLITLKLQSLKNVLKNFFCCETITGVKNRSTNLYKTNIMQRFISLNP